MMFVYSEVLSLGFWLAMPLATDEPPELERSHASVAEA
jgi:hypothetical protein